MTRKRKRRSSVVEIGTGPRESQDLHDEPQGWIPEFSLSWKEGGQRKTPPPSPVMDEARLIAQQITVRLTNGWTTGDEATNRDIDLLRHCENLAAGFGVTLTAAMDEWASARKAAGEIPLSDAVRFYRANRADLVAVRTTVQVAAEFVASRQSSGVSDIYVRSAATTSSGSPIT